MIPWQPAAHRGGNILITTIILAALYIFLLHPVSGSLGGFFYIFVAEWTIPSAINVLLAWWCARRAATTLRPRALLFCLFSFVFGINLSLPALLHGTPETTSVINRPIELGDRPISLWARDRLSVTADPLSSSVAVSGDEDCGCMYFVEHASFLNQFTDAAQAVGRYTPYMFIPTIRQNVHYEITFTPRKDVPNMVDMSLDVYDRDEKTATFTQRGIPYDASLDDRIGRDGGLLNGHFLENSFTMLMHDNFWTWLLRDWAAYLPRRTIDEFLVNAIHHN